MDELQDMFRQGVESSFRNIYKKFKDNYIEMTLKDGHAEPLILVLELDDGVIMSNPEPLRNKEGDLRKIAKRYAKKVVREQTHLPVGVILATEAWYKAIAKDEKYDGLTDKQGNPKQGVRDALVISGMTCTRQSEVNVYEMIEQDNKIIDLVQFNEGQAEPFVLVEFYEMLRKEIEQEEKKYGHQAKG